MIRAFLYLLIAIPLLMPGGFCPCQLGHGHAACAAEVDSDHDHDDGGEPADDEHDCPCKSVDYAIRGFLTHDSDVTTPEFSAALPVEIASIAIAQTRSAETRERVPIFPTPPRFVLYLSLLI